MIFGMPVSSFLTFLSWPVLWIAISLYMYFKMAKEDEMDEESWMEVDNS